MYQLNIDPEGYLLSISYAMGGVAEGVPALDTLEGLDLSGERINAYRWDGEKLVLDEDKLDEITEAASAREDELAISPVDRIEAQVYYTAMMTDTLMEG